MGGAGARSRRYVIDQSLLLSSNSLQRLQDRPIEEPETNKVICTESW